MHVYTYLGGMILHCYYNCRPRRAQLKKYDSKKVSTIYPYLFTVVRVDKYSLVDTS